MLRGPRGMAVLGLLGTLQTVIWAAGLPSGVGASGWPVRAVVLFALQVPALALVWNRRDARATGIVLGFALVYRSLAVLWPPDLSSDVQRYVWDGRVLDSGRSPYDYAPAAPELAELRDARVFSKVNRPDTVTVYPPGAQLGFLTLRRIGLDTVTGVKTATVAGDLLSLILLVALLKRRGLPAARAVVYAWSPLVVSEIAVSGHLEAFVVPLMLGALLLGDRRPGWSGALLGGATLLKLYPAILLAAMPRRRIVIFATLAIAAGYAPFALASKTAVLGFLPDYFRSGEDFNLGLRGFLQEALAFPLGQAARPTALALCSAAFFLSLAWLVRRATADATLSARCIFAAFLLFLPSALHPWYALPFAALLAFEFSPAWFWLLGALPLSYLKYGAPDGEMPVWVRLVEWLPTYALLFAEHFRQRRVATEAT